LTFFDYWCNFEIKQKASVIINKKTTMNNILKRNTILFLLTVAIAIFISCKKRSLPEVTTDNVTQISQTTAVSGGNITNNGGADVTARGVCWNTSENPTVGASKTSDGSGNGTFTSTLTGLKPNTGYYVRAYATNSEGTGYGENKSFTTSYLAALHDPVFVLQFNDNLSNHNMHIATDGNYYYTCNGGTASIGKINKYSLSGVFIASYPIVIDMRSIMYNKVDKYFYVSGFESGSECNIYKITNMQTGSYSKLFTNLYEYYQSGVALSDDGQYLFAFNKGYLKEYKLADGTLVKTFTGLSCGANAATGDGAVAVDPDYIYTWNSATMTVYVYNLDGQFVKSMTLANGNYGFSLSFLDGYLFVAKDGNYSTGTWYCYNIRKDITKGFAVNPCERQSDLNRIVRKDDSTK